MFRIMTRRHQRMMAALAVTLATSATARAGEELTPPPGPVGKAQKPLCRVEITDTAPLERGPA